MSGITSSSFSSHKANGGASNLRDSGAKKFNSSEQQVTADSGIACDDDEQGYDYVSEDDYEDAPEGSGKGKGKATEAQSILKLTPPPTPEKTQMNGRPTLCLPTELLSQIIRRIRDQHTLWKLCQVSKQWYFATTEHLYRYPKIDSTNYLYFVRTIAPSSTNKKPSTLGDLVRRLDLSHIVHDGRPSYTARLLRRTANSLEEFIAPQASFGYIVFVALTHCRKLRLLDLSLISQSVSLDDLFTYIKYLPDLTILNFPRSSVFDPGMVDFQWPPRIKTFSLAGGLSSSFLNNCKFPKTLTEFKVSHCPAAEVHTIPYLVNRLGSQLTNLYINYHIPSLTYNSLDNVLVMCPNLQRLLVAADYVTGRMFDEENTPDNHPLKCLEIDSSGVPGLEKKMQPDEIYICVGEDRLQELRIVRVSERLGWVERLKSQVEDLVNLLEEKEAARGTKQLAGVWEFKGEVRGW
ncbi:hypothetical protein RUND412_006152 [Rhizina undulata]